MNNLKHCFRPFQQAGYLGSLLVFLTSAPITAQESDSTTSVPRPAKVIVVEAHNSQLVRQYPAIVYPSQEAELSFRVSGQVVSLPIRAASQLDQGDVIAELDKRDFENAVARLESERDQAQAQMDALVKGARAEEIVALQAAVYAAQARVDQVKAQVARTRELFEKEIVAKAQLENDEASLSVAQAELRTAQEQLEIGQSGGREEDVAAAQAAVRGLEADLKNARDNLNDATLRAPFDGIVARRDIDNFTNIQAGETIVLLQKLSTIHLVYDIPGADVLMWTERGLDSLIIEVELTGNQAVLTASELVEFSTQADAGTQTYQARTSVEIPDGVTALAGMVGRVRVSSPETGAKTSTVPVTALATAPDGAAFVWVVDPGTKAVTARPVTTGDMTGDQVAIVSGLEAGETIVTAGVSRLSEGLVIRPISRVGN